MVFNIINILQITNRSFDILSISFIEFYFFSVVSLLDYMTVKLIFFIVNSIVVILHVELNTSKKIYDGHSLNNRNFGVLQLEQNYSIGLTWLTLFNLILNTIWEGSITLIVCVRELNWPKGNSLQSISRSITIASCALLR